MKQRTLYLIGIFDSALALSIEINNHANPGVVAALFVVLGLFIFSYNRDGAE